MAKRYPAKVLLFGEYSLLVGSKALSLPLHEFDGGWELRRKETPPDHPLVGKWVDYLDREASFLDVSLLRQWIADHYFESSIPVGYGLGSSGALCAGVYDCFATDKNAETGVLKSRFSLMERFFHGSSSGLDPLTSYLDSPLLVSSDVVRKMEPLKSGVFTGRIFLLDSGCARMTGPLVEYFLEQCERRAFADMCRESLAPAVDKALDAFLTQQTEDLEIAWNQISILQYEHFRKMIPEDMRKIWALGLETSAFSIKLCGAGGGGYFLGWLQEGRSLPADLSGHTILFPAF